MTDLLTDCPNISEAKEFRLQNQKFMLTYKTHLDKIDICEWIEEQICKGKKKIKFIRCAHENGENDEANPYPHTHILIDCGFAFQSRKARIFDYNEIHPMIQIVRTRAHWENCLKYIAKEDPDNADLLEDTANLAIGVWSCENKADALAKYVKKPSDALGISVLYDNRPEPELDDEYPMPDQQWCRDVLDKIINGPKDHRSIHWIWEPIGNTCKSMFANYCMANKIAYVVNSVGGCKNFSTIVESALEQGWNKKCMIFDLSRDDEQHQIYQPLENLKNGLVTTTKYRGKSMLIGKPHIIVLANWPPDESRMSMDRWKIRKIKRDKENKDKLYLNPEL